MRVINSHWRLHLQYFWSLYTWIVAIIGGLIVIGLFNLIFRPKRRV